MSLQELTQPGVKSQGRWTGISWICRCQASGLFSLIIRLQPTKPFPGGLSFFRCSPTMLCGVMHFLESINNMPTGPSPFLRSAFHLIFSGFVGGRHAFPHYVDHFIVALVYRLSMERSWNWEHESSESRSAGFGDVSNSISLLGHHYFLLWPERQSEVVNYVSETSLRNGMGFMFWIWNTEWPTDCSTDYSFLGT